MSEQVHLEPAGGDRGLRRTVQVNWEVVAWVAIVVLTLFTRLWDLGDRAMSHDESLHTYYSWKLFIGEGYQHDPMMHGPLLYHVTALFYFLFGVSDLTARLLAVVTGLGLVLSPLLVRKWLGSAGALAAGVMLLVSPTVMYYSRYIRHDIPVELFTVLMFASFIRYLDSRAGKWVVLAGLAGAGAVTSAEMSYINAFVLLSFIGIALVVERMNQHRAYMVDMVFAALGLGLLVYAGVAMTGRWPSVATEGTPVRLAMQGSFLLSGLCLIYGLVSPLLNRPRPVPQAGEEAPAWRLIDVLPRAMASSAGSAAAAWRSLAVGGLLLLLGVVIVRAPDIEPGAPGGLAKVLATLGELGAIGLVLLGVGWFLSLYALVTRLTSQASRAARYVAIAVGAVAALVWSSLWYTVGRPAAEATADGALGAPLLTLVIASAMVLVLGILEWLLEQHEARGLASAVAGVSVDAIGGAVVVFVVVYTLLFTTFFTNPNGIDGFTRSIRYWLDQHDVVRGGQPWYYYGLFTPMYEFLPFALAVAAVVVYALRRRLRVGLGNDSGDPDRPSPAAWAIVPMMITWAAGNFWIYSWAGEKMPWLIVHLAVPLIFLAGRLVGDLAAAVDWAAMRQRGWMVAGLALLVLLVTTTWLSVSPFQGETQQALARTSGFLIGLPVVALLLWALWRVAGGLPRRQAVLAAVLMFLGLLLVVNTRYSVLANFVNDELATEYIVYAHGTPDDKEVYNLLLEMQQQAGIDKPLTVGYDNEVSWPFTWYFRHTDWPAAVYLGEKPSGTLNQDVVLVGSPNYGNFEPYLRDRYDSIEYRRMWWPNEGYKGLTPRVIWEGLTDPKARRNALNILLYRRYTKDPAADVPEPKPLTDWYHHANMKLYIRRDLIERVWPLVQARPDWLQQVEPAAQGPSRSAELTIEATYTEGPDSRPIVMPKGIKLGADGRLYVVDHGQDRVVVFDTDGEAVEVVADGQLTYPGEGGKLEHSAWGLGVAPDGAIYIADTWNHRVVKYVAGRQVAEWGAFGNPATADTDLSLVFGPRDIAIGPDGNLYVSDTGNDRIVVLSTDLAPLRAFGGAGPGLGQFDEPTSLAFDPANGDLFVADLWNYRIQRFDKDLRAVADWTVDGWQSDEAAHKAYLAVGPGSTVVVSDPQGQRVWVYDRQGTVLATLDLPADSRGLDQPIGVAVDDAGRIYVASSNSGLVTRYAPLAAITQALGGGAAEGAGPSPTGEQAEGEAAEVSPTAAEAEGEAAEVSPTAGEAEGEAAKVSPTASGSAEEVERGTSPTAGDAAPTP